MTNSGNNSHETHETRITRLETAVETTMQAVETLAEQQREASRRMEQNHDVTLSQIQELKSAIIGVGKFDLRTFLGFTASVAVPMAAVAFWAVSAMIAPLANQIDRNELGVASNRVELQEHAVLPAHQGAEVRIAVLEDRMRIGLPLLIQKCSHEEGECVIPDGWGRLAR